MPKYRVTADIYEDVRGDGSEMGEFRGTDEVTVRAASEEDATENAAAAEFVRQWGHAWIVRDVDVLGTDAADGDAVSLAADGGDTPVSGRLTCRLADGAGDEYINVVSGDGAARRSVVLLNDEGLDVVGSYGAGDAGEFYDHANLPFHGEVVEVDADGVLYVTSAALTKHVWVDPLTMRVTGSSVYDYA